MKYKQDIKKPNEGYKEGNASEELTTGGNSKKGVCSEEHKGGLLGEQQGDGGRSGGMRRGEETIPLHKRQEDEALHVILTNISPLPKESWLTELEHHKTRITTGPKRLSPVIRNQRLILAIINSHHYASYWEDKIKVTQYYDWRVGVSPVRPCYLGEACRS